MPEATRSRPDAWLIVAAILMTSACARANPGDAAGDSVLRHQVERQGPDLIRLVRFTRLGGQRSAFLGVTTYTMEYKAQIEFLKDACYGGGLSARPYVAPRYDGSGRPAPEDAAAACHRIHVSRGERRDVTGSLPFEKLREGGWRGPDERVY
jgi:hypothetical protein